jgi:repressor LexA
MKLLPVRITARQGEVLAFIKEYIASAGYPPTSREIGIHFGWALNRSGGGSNAVSWHLKALVRKGWITVQFSRARAIQIVIGKGHEFPPCPDCKKAVTWTLVQATK